MKLQIVAVLLFLTSIASAQSTKSLVNNGNDHVVKAAKGERSTLGGSINAPIETPTSSWRKKLKFEMFYAVWGDVSAVNHGENSANGIDMYLQAMRDIGKGQSLGLRLNGAQNQTNESLDTNETVLTDPQLVYKNPAFDSTLRLSFPVLATSRKVGRYELRYNGGADLAESGRFTLGFGGEARAYTYSRDTAGQMLARTRLVLTPSYEFMNNVSVYSNAMFDFRWNKSGEGYQYLDGATADASSVNSGIKSDPKNLDRHAVLEAGLSIEAVPEKLLIETFLSQDHQFEAERASLFDQDETSYNLEMTLSI